MLYNNINYDNKFGYRTVNHYINSITPSIMEYKIPIDKSKYYKAMLMVLNFNLKLSDLEISIIADLLSKKIYTINPSTRDMLCISLDISKFLINNYIKRLKDKGVIIPNSDGKTYNINPSIIDMVKDRKVSFEFEVVE